MRTTRPPRASTVSRPMMASEGPVAAFDQHIRLQAADDLLRIVFIEHHHRVHAFERGEDLGAFVLGIDRARRALDGLNRSIGVHSHDQRVPFTPGSLAGSEHGRGAGDRTRRW